MKKILGFIGCFVLVVIASMTLYACGESDKKTQITASNSEIELVLGTDQETKSVEFELKNFGNGSDQLNFSLEDNEKDIVSISQSYKSNGKTVLTVTGLSRGTARIFVTSLQGSQKFVLTVKVIQPITGIELKNEYANSLYVVAGRTLSLSQQTIWNFIPSDTNQRDLDFSFVGESQGCEIIDGNLVVSDSCSLQSVTLQAVSSSNSEISTEFEVKILKPIQVVLSMDGKTVVENVSSSSEIQNYLEIFPTEKDESIYPNSKTVTLIVKAGSQDETLKIDKVFGTDLDKFSVLQTGYSYDSALKLHRYIFLIQANSQEAGNIDNVKFTVSYNGYNAGESNYVENSVVLNLYSYNKPDSVEVNGANKSVEIDIFENSINLTNGQMVEFSILPGNLKSGENYITIWAKDFENLPVSLYRLNATRTGYICVFGYDKNGNAVGNENGTIRYATISSGTKLYAFINSKYLSNVTNKSAQIYAQASAFCDFTATETSRALTNITFTINPNAKNVFIADKTESGLEVKQSETTIFVEYGKTITQYIAIDPASFTIGANSSVKIANGNIATIGTLSYYAKDENYVYGKFTIIPNKVGSTTLTVSLSDGKTVNFSLVVICPLEELEINLEDVTYGGTVIESDIVPYKNISDTVVKINGIEVTRQLNKLSIANSGGSGVQLIKKAVPSNAQYYLEYKFFDFTIPDGKTLKTISISDIDVANLEWSSSSSIINTSRLVNSTLLEAINSGVEGNVLIRIDIKAMKSDGTYTEDPAGSLFYLVNFFVPIKGVSIKNGTIDVYSYDSIGDKFLDSNNISKSIGSFSVTVNPVNVGLIPTYLKNLEIFVNGSTVNISNLFVNDLLYLNADGVVTYNLSAATLKVTRKLEGNVYTFTIQALKSCDANFIFAMSISEINPDKKFTAISRVIITTAVEISEIEVINASEEDPIYIQNQLKSADDFKKIIIQEGVEVEVNDEEAYNNYVSSLIDDVYELELVYNIFANSEKEITNKSLEFEFNWDYLSENDYYIDENGDKQFFAYMVGDKLTVVRVAYDYSDYFNLSEEERNLTTKDEKKKLAQFGANGTLVIYPTSNYYESTNGWNGEEPIVRIPIKVADGKSSESAFEIYESEDLKLLGESPASSFILRNNIFMPVDYEPVENFMGKLSGRYQSEITPYGIYAIKPLFKMIAESGVVEDMFYYTAYLPELGYTFEDYISTYEGVTYYGGLANINKGVIRNIGSNYNGTLDTNEILANMGDGMDVFGYISVFETHYGTTQDNPDSLTTIKYKNIFNSSISSDSQSVSSLLSFLCFHDDFGKLLGNSIYGLYYGIEYKAGELVKYTGGLVGLNLGTIESTDDSLIKGYMATGISGANIGGIAGVNKGTIKNYSFIGGVVGVESAGGIVALNKGTLRDCKFVNVVPFFANVSLLILNNSAYAYSNDVQFAVGGISAISEDGTIFGCVCEASYDIDELSDIIKSFPSDCGVVYVHHVEAIDESAPEDYYNSIVNGTEYSGAKPLVWESISDDELKLYFDSTSGKFPAEWNALSTDQIFYRLNTTQREVYSGGLVGISSNTQISRSMFSGALPVKESNSGGLVGNLISDYNEATNLVLDCYSLVHYDVQNVNLGHSAGQFIYTGSLSEIKNCYIKSNVTSLPSAYSATGTPVASFIAGTDKKTGLLDAFAAFSCFNVEGMEIIEAGQKSYKDLYNYGTATLNLQNKVATLSRTYNEGATNEQSDIFTLSTSLTKHSSEDTSNYYLNINRFMLRGNEVYINSISYEDSLGVVRAYPEEGVTINLAEESNFTRTIVNYCETVGENENTYDVYKVVEYTRTVSNDGTLTLNFVIKYRKINQETGEETTELLRTESYSFKRTSSTDVSKLNLCFDVNVDSDLLNLNFYSFGNTTDSNYIPNIRFSSTVGSLDLNSTTQDATYNGYFYDEETIKYKDFADVVYYSGYDTSVKVYDSSFNHVAINDLNLLYYKLYLIGLYNNFDDFMKESVWEKFSYYNPYEDDFKILTGEMTKDMIKDLYCSLFGLTGEYETDADLKTAITNVVENIIIPQINNSLADLKNDVVILNGQFNGTLTGDTGLGYDYSTKDLWLALYETAFGESGRSEADSILELAGNYIDTAQGISSISTVTLSNIEDFFGYVDSIYSVQYQMLKLLSKFMEDDDILGGITTLNINGTNYTQDVWILDLLRTLGPIYHDSSFMVPSVLGGVESFYSTSGIPSTCQGFKDAGWDIENLYDAGGNEIESESVWVFEDGILPYLRGTKVSIWIENYKIEVNPESKLDKSKIIKGTYIADDYYIMFYNETYGDLAMDPKAQAQLDKLNSVELVDFLRIYDVNGMYEGSIADFSIHSSDINIIKIVNGRLQLVGTGYVTITIKPLFRSLASQDSDITKTIQIFVTNSVGTISIYEGINSNESLDGKEDVTIIKDRPSYFTVANKNVVSLNHNLFMLKTNPLAVQIDITYIDEEENIVSAYKTGESVNLFEVLGLTAGNETNKFAFGTITVSTNDGVLTDEDYHFNFNIDYQKTYINSLAENEWKKELIRNQEEFKTLTSEQINERKQVFIELFIARFQAVSEDAFNFGFNFKVAVRAERILLSVDKAEIDPSTVLSVDAELVSNRTSDRLIMKIIDENEKIVWISEDFGETKFENNSDLFNASITNGTAHDGKISAKLLISIAENQRQLVNETKTYKIVLTDSNGDVEKSFDLVVKPQEIITVTYTHHNRDDASTESGIKIQDQPSSILVPGDSGILSINLFPVYATYSKIVLTSSVVNGNYVLMEQMYKSGDYFLSTSTTTGYSSERDVNILTIKNTNNSTGSIYVRTKILDSVKEGLYFPITIQIFAIDEDGNEYLSKVETITLISEVIEPASITINGGKDAVVARGTTAELKLTVGENQTLASFGLSEFDKSKSYSYDYASIYFNTSEYEIDNGRKIYSGTLTVGLDAEIEGDGYFKIQTIVQKIINGRLESTTDSIEIRVVDFLVEGITIEDNDEQDNVFDTPSAIEKDLKFNFKLSETPEMISASQEKSINRIKNAKAEFLKTVAYKFSNSQGYEYILNTDREFKAQESGGFTSDAKNIVYNLYYTSDMTPYISKSGEPQANKYFTIRYDNENATTLTIVGTSVGSVNMTIRIGYRLPNTKQDNFITYNFSINVQLYSDEDKPTPIETAEQFVTYLQSESEQYASTNYILMNDIVLENFVPFEKTNFASLDGNNKVITIKSFNLSQSTDILNLGLFVNVSEDATLKNLTVSYGLLEDIIVDETIFKSVNFGGIAVYNSGVIYNCEVVSLDIEGGDIKNGGIKIYFDSTKTKHKLDTTSVLIGGLVVENYTGASITNSRVGGKGSFTKVSYDAEKGTTTKSLDFGEFVIVGQGDMAGFVVKNNGLISASYFAGATLTNMTTSASLNATSGFVLYNNLGALITTSYSEGIKLITDLSVNITGGGIVSQGTSAGFAYQNNGTITDCYSNIRLAGDSTGRLVSGFVYNNQADGKLERCYSASTIVGELTTQMPFTGKNAREEIMQLSEDGLVDCYYLVKNVDTGSILEDKYGTGAQAVQISTFDETTFKTFAMTSKNDYDGIWSWNGLFPELVSANQKAISVRRIIKNYSSIESLDIFPYLNGYEYGSANNPIIIRTGDEFNRVFGQETTLTKGAYYAISQMYDKNLGIVFGNYRLVSDIDFSTLKYVENIRIASSIMLLANSGDNCGSFDGNGLTIKNVEIALDTQSSVGIFSQISSGGVFKNVTITVKSVSSGISGIYVGTVAGLVQNSAICNVSVYAVSEDDQNRSRITGQNIVGGVVGAVTGNSKVSSLTSSISVISGNKNAEKDVDTYTQTILRDNFKNEGGIFVDKNKDYGFAGGVIGLLDIYQSIMDNQNVSTKPNAVNLKYFGKNISVQGSFVGGVVGYVGMSTYLANASFTLTGTESTLNQRLISYENTIGGIVGVSYGDLFELGIEHENETQKIIEENLKGYYSSSASVFRGNTKLFNSTGETLNYAGGIVGQMLGGNLTTSFSNVDVSIAGADYAGGIIGLCKTNANLFELYAFGDVDAKVAGGLVGQNLGCLTFDKCTAINFYSKENSSITDSIKVANNFNSGNFEITGYTGKNGVTYDEEKTYDYRDFTLKISTTETLVLHIVNNEEVAKTGIQIVGYDSNKDIVGYDPENNIEVSASKGKVAKFEVFGKTCYVTNDTKDTKRTLLIREQLTNDENYVAQYYYLNKTGKVVMMKEGKDGKLYDPSNNAIKFSELGKTYYIDTLTYKVAKIGIQIVGYDSNNDIEGSTYKGKVAKFEVFGKTCYMTNGSNRTLLTREQLANNENYVAQYYYLNGTSKVVVMKEKKDGELYDPSGNKVTFNPSGKTYYIDTLTYKVYDNEKVGENEIATYEFNEENSKVQTINLKTLSALVGTNVGTNSEGKEVKGDYSILYYNQPGDKAVFANKTFKYSGYEIVLGEVDGNPAEGNKFADDLTFTMSDYKGFELDSPVINKMFLGSFWDPSAWELREDRILPTIYFGVTAKVLYIEKPTDILKLSRYYKRDNVVIFGDNPTTTFNPYTYEPGKSSTYGEFEASELAGLTVKDGKLIFNFSAIEGSLQNSYEGAYFSKFFGTMYGEKEGAIILTGMTRAFFDNIAGAKISKLTFDGSSNVATAVLANTMTAQSQISDITFQNITIDSPQAKIGVVAGEIIGVVDFGNITISNCEITSTSTGENITETMYKEGWNKDTGKNEKTEEYKYYLVVYAGIVAGRFDNNTNAIAEISLVEVKECSVTTVEVKECSVTTPNKPLDMVYVGGMFGETAGSINYSYNNVSGTTTTVNDIHNSEKPEEKQEEVYAGGYVGYAQGTTTIVSDKTGYEKAYGIDSPESDTILTNVSIELGQSKTANVGLLFGRINTLSTKIDEEWNVKVDGSIYQTQTKTVNLINLGGIAGQVSNVSQFNNVDVTLNDTLSLQLVALKVEDSESSPPSSVGGLFGLIVGSSEVKNVQFGSDLTVTAEGNSQKIFVIYVGGIIGRLNSTNESTISNSKYSGTIDLTIPESGKCYAGGIVGFMGPQASITESKVSGDIKINAKLSASLCVGGIVGWIDAGSGEGYSVSKNYAWGNIEINKGNNLWLNGSDYALNNCYVGGIVGCVGNKCSITENYSLTSMYVFAKGKINDYVCAIVGQGFYTNGDENSDNYYCHQINLATDAKGQNLYYSNILSELTGEEKPLNGEVGEEGTKLNPKKNPSLTAGLGEGYYVLTYNYTFASINKPSAVELNGHLVGDGHTITASGDKSLFGTISGYISGVKIKFTSKQFNGTDKGNVTSVENGVPSGVADVNNGIIFAVSVEVSGCSSGFELLAAEFGTVQGTVVAGVVGKNTGKIADTGVVLNVKSAYAGFVGNNTGYIENCYSTGSVHNGAQYAFCSGSGKGVVINSYTAIKCATSDDSKVIYNQGKINKFYYDSLATGKTATAGGTMPKSTNEFALNSSLGANGIVSNNVQDFELSDTNGLVWVRNESYNFGYPCFRTGTSTENNKKAAVAYKGFEYLDIKTKDDDGPFYLPHVGFLKLMSGKELSEKKNVYVFMTDMDLNSTWTAITTNAGRIYGQGYHIYNIGVAQFVKTNTGTITSLSLIYAASENTISAVIDSNSGTLSGIIVSGATCTDAGLVKTNTETITTTDTGTIKNTGKITNCQNYNTVSGGENAGGIVSVMNSGSITGCRNFGSVTSSTGGNAGGIVGKVPSSSTVSITNCANFGSITGSIWVGGIVGDYFGHKAGFVNENMDCTMSGNGGNQAGSFEIEDIPFAVKVYQEGTNLSLVEGAIFVNNKQLVRTYLYNEGNGYSYTKSNVDIDETNYRYSISCKFEYKSAGIYTITMSVYFCSRFDLKANQCYNSGTVTGSYTPENTTGQSFLNYWNTLTRIFPAKFNYDEAELNQDYSVTAGSTVNVYTGAGLAYALYECQNYTVNLMSDVDLSKYVWKPVSGFTGTFNGNGYKIYFGSNQNLFADDSVLTTDSDAYVVGVGNYAGMHIYERTFEDSSFVQYNGKNLWYSFGNNDDATLMWIKKNNGTYIYKFSYIKMNPSSTIDKITYILIVGQIENNSVEQTFVYNGGYDEAKSSVTCTNPAIDFTTKVKIYGYNTKFKELE